jgi:hypothetical protein
MADLHADRAARRVREVDDRRPAIGLFVGPQARTRRREAL